MSASAPYHIVQPGNRSLPLVVSAPHVGIKIPSDIFPSLDPSLAEVLPDTDWNVHKLYDFVPQLGGVLIFPEYSRYVIDLNRPLEDAPLYHDRRLKTELIPTVSFSGKVLLKPGYQLSQEERERRVNFYYRPYHRALREQLDLTKKLFGFALLFDAHSIQRYVPSVSPLPFADMIIGDRGGTTAANGAVEALHETLKSYGYDVRRNSPFKGGQITRSFGKPDEGIHAIQLEMAQDVYLRSGSTECDPDKLYRLQPALAAALTHALRSLS